MCRYITRGAMSVGLYMSNRHQHGGRQCEWMVTSISSLPPPLFICVSHNQYENFLWDLSVWRI